MGKNKGLGQYRKFTLLKPGVFERDYLQEVLQGVDLTRFKAICIKLTNSSEESTEIKKLPKTRDFFDVICIKSLDQATLGKIYAAALSHFDNEMVEHGRYVQIISKNHDRVRHNLTFIKREFFFDHFRIL